MTYTKKEIIQQLKDLKERKGDTRTNTIKRDIQITSCQTIRNHFDSLMVARKKAELEIINYRYHRKESKNND